MKKASFIKKERLKKNSSIKHVFDKGVPFKTRLINVYILKKDTGALVNRAGFIIRRRLYNNKTVLRNRFRRILREAYRNTKHLLPPGHDIVILAGSIDKSTKTGAIDRELRSIFEKYSKKYNNILS